jgi:hypothetical protein
MCSICGSDFVFLLGMKRVVGERCWLSWNSLYELLHHWTCMRERDVPASSALIPATGSTPLYLGGRALLIEDAIILDATLMRRFLD